MTTSARALRGPQDGDQLATRNLSVHFEGVKAVDAVDLVLKSGEILGLIGPNGAGKTTLVNALSGFQRPTMGEVRLRSIDVTDWPPHRLSRNGVSRTFQNVRLFARLTVFENVELGAVTGGIPHRETRRWAWELLERMNLASRANQYASALPHGQARQLGILRALASRPSFLLLDEPAAGLNEHESDELVEALTAIRSEFGCALMVIEHDMRVIMRLCERIHVLNYGRTICIGTPTEVRTDPAVKEAYLGSRKKVDLAPD